MTRARSLGVEDRLLERGECGPPAALQPVDPEEQVPRAGRAQVVAGCGEELERFCGDTPCLLDHRVRVGAEAKLQPRHRAVHPDDGVRVAFQLGDQRRADLEVAGIVARATRSSSAVGRSGSLAGKSVSARASRLSAAGRSPRADAFEPAAASRCPARRPARGRVAPAPRGSGPPARGDSPRSRRARRDRRVRRASRRSADASLLASPSAIRRRRRRESAGGGSGRRRRRAASRAPGGSAPCARARRGASRGRRRRCRCRAPAPRRDGRARPRRRRARSPSAPPSRAGRAAPAAAPGSSTGRGCRHRRVRARASPRRTAGCRRRCR